MKGPLFTLLVGPPGSGKTTWANTQSGASLLSGARFSNSQRLLTAVREATAANAQNIIVDRTNPTREGRAALLALAKAQGYHTKIRVFSLDPETCLDRCRRRRGNASLPSAASERAIFSFFETYEAPNLDFPEADELEVAIDQTQPTASRPPPTSQLNPDAVSDKLVLLIVSGLSDSDLRQAAAEKLHIPADRIAKTIKEARRRITLAAAADRLHEVGAALTRIRDLYRRALAVQDTKTALAAQKELNKLLDLYRPAAAPPDQPDASVAELAAARRHLEPLALAAPTESFSEICRLAALKIIDLQSPVSATQT